jgi:hypothetical protein
MDWFERGIANGPAEVHFKKWWRVAGLEIGDTAGLKTCATTVPRRQ